MLAGKSEGIDFSQVRFVGRQIWFDMRIGQLYVEL